MTEPSDEAGEVRYQEVAPDAGFSRYYDAAIQEVTDEIRRFHVINQTEEAVVASGVEFPNGNAVVIARVGDDYGDNVVRFDSVQEYLQNLQGTERGIVWEDTPRATTPKNIE